MFYPKSPFHKCPDIESQLLQWNKNGNDLLEWICQTPTTTTYRVNLLHSESMKEIKREILQKLSEKYTNIPEIFTVDDVPEVVCVANLKNICIEMNKDLPEIIIDTICAAAVLRGAHIYGPGVMAMPKGSKVDEMVNIFADLDGHCKKGTNTLYESENKVFIGIGKIKMQRHQLFGNQLKPSGIAVEMHWTISSVPSIGDLSSRYALLQNFPSIVCSKILNPQQGDIILDMCSAPGNKTTHIAELIMDKGTIIALDKTAQKIQLVKDKISNNNLKSIHSFAFDSTKSLTTELIENFNILNGPPFPPEIFDRILLDAPCSALGNRPVLASKMTLKMLQSYPNLQKKLFANAVGLLKPGGTLVYSTCTVTTSENEEIVVWAKEKFKNIKLVDAAPHFGGKALEVNGLNSEQRGMLQRFGLENIASNINGVGFFIAKFCKITD